MTLCSQHPPFSRLSAQMDALLIDLEIPVMGYAIALVKDGHIAFEGAGGFRRYWEEQPQRCLPMETDSRCRIASVSKLFTCVAVMQQAELGRLVLDGDAGDYLGFSLRNPHFPQQTITPRMLMAHISSLRDGGMYALPKRIPLSACFRPGTSWWEDGSHFAAPDGVHNMGPGGYYYYSNLNYGVLGTIVERLSGERFDRYMCAHVLKPMGLEASFNPGDFSPEQLYRLASIYKRTSGGVWAVDQPWTAQADYFQDVSLSPDRIRISNPDLGLPDREEDVSDYIPGTNATIFSPQGGLRISAHELALFCQTLLRGGIAPNGRRILSSESVQELFTPVWVYSPHLDNRDPTDSAKAYGAGVNIISTALGGDHMVPYREDITLYGHTGAAYGLLSACYVDPARDVGFAYLLNGTGSDHDAWPGQYSGRKLWHERIMTAICEVLFS